jgi:alpha-tubulin suppressor-like RCC1 family protein
MTITALGSTRFVKKGVYSGTAEYQKDDVVLYNGAWYLCTANAVAGTLPTNTSFFTVWQNLWNWKGQHNNTSTVYAVGDVVYYLADYTTGSTNAGTFTRKARNVYRCIQAHTSDGTNTFKPINTTYWQPISLANYNDGSVNVSTATITEKWGVIGNSPDKLSKFPNEGRVGETVDCLLLGTNKNQAFTYDWSCFITESGQIRVWGRGSNSCTFINTGNGTSVGPATAVPSFFFHDFFRSTSNGGAGVHSTPDGKHPRCIQLETGYDWWVALFNNGEVYTGGYGGNGEMGNRATTNRWIARVGGTYTEVAVATNSTTHLFRDVRISMIAASGGERAASSHHVLALDEDGQVWSWGYNAYGQLGDNSVTSRSIPTLIPKAQFGLTSVQKVVAIWAGGGEYGYSFALTDQNKLFAWGYNNYGHLGLGVTSTNVRVPTEVTTQTWTTAAAGTIKKLVTADSNTTQYSTTAILTSKGAIYCAGYNGSGHMMKGDTAQANSFLVCTSGPGATNTAKDVFLTNGNAASMFVIDNTNRLFAAGANNGGQLGIAGTNANYTASQSCQKSVNGVMSNMTNVKTLTALGGGNGTNTSVIVTTNDGWSYGAGYNGYGQLSMGWQAAYHYTTTDTAKENTGQRGFNMVKMPSALAGKVAEVWFTGYTDGTATNYGTPIWVSTTGMPYQAGYNAGWSISGHNNSAHRNIMTPISLS